MNLGHLPWVPQQMPKVLSAIILVQASLLYQILFSVQYQSLADLAILSIAIDENKNASQTAVRDSHLCASHLYKRVVDCRSFARIVESDETKIPHFPSRSGPAHRRAALSIALAQLRAGRAVDRAPRATQRLAIGR